MARPTKPAISAKLVLAAATHDDIDALTRLVADGADLNAPWRGYRAMHAVIQEKPHGAGGDASAAKLRTLRWLLEHGADPEQLGAWPPARALLVAAFTGVPVLVAVLREGGARVDLFVECALGDVAAVRARLAADPALAASRDAGGLTVLQCCAASRVGPPVALREIAGALLDGGADPNALTRSWSHDVDAAYLAIHARHVEMLDLLLQRGASADAALSPAAWAEDDAFLQTVLRHGANVDRPAADGRPVLNELVRWGQVRQALRLLAAGASPNVPDARGWTALHQAASRGNVRMFTALVAAGGDLTRRDRTGDTPHDVAAAQGKKAILPLAEVERPKRRR